MIDTIVPLGGVSRTLPARYSMVLSAKDTDEPYALTLSMVAETCDGEETLSCQIGRQTLERLLEALDDAWSRMEGSP